MFKKSIDSILKRANKIVTDLQDISDTCDSEANILAENIQDMEHKQTLLMDEARRATALADKWSQLV